MENNPAITRREWLQALSLAVFLKLITLTILYYGWFYIPHAQFEEPVHGWVEERPAHARSCAPVCKMDTWMTRPGVSFRENLANFDGAWFIRIAALGYQRLAEGDYDLAEETARLTVMDQLGYEDGLNYFGYRHWPLMPWLMRALAPVVGGFLNAGLILANGCYFLLALMLYRLCRLDFGHGTGITAVVLLSIHPGAWSLTALYNEAPFLAFAAAAVVAIRRERFVAAGVWGFLMTMTRPDGVVVAVVLLYEYLALTSGDRKASFSSVLAPGNLRQGAVNAIMKPRVLALALVPLGTALAMFYYYRIAGSPFAFAVAHEATPGGHVSPPWQVFYHTFLRGLEFQLKETVLHLVTVLVLVLAWTRTRRSYLAWMILFTLFHNLHHAHSFLRYHAHLLPLFIVAADLLEDRPALRAAVIALSAALFGVFAAMFVNGYWIA